MSSKLVLLNSMEEIFEIACSEDGDMDEIGAVAAECLGYEWPPEDQEDDQDD